MFDVGAGGELLGEEEERPNGNQEIDKPPNHPTQVK